MIHAYYADHHDVPLPKGHRFPMHKYRKLRLALLAEGLLDQAHLHPGPLIEREDLLRAHTAEYVDAVWGASLGPKAQRALGLPLGPELVMRARSSAGGTLAATKRALDAGFCGNLSGGTHHAFAGHGEGFCVFNDLAIAALWMLASGLANRVAIVDFDVHQGNGTASIVGGHPKVYSLSIHCEANYPFVKVPGTHDVSLAAGTGDAEFLQAMVEALEQVWQWGPDVVLYQAGVDTLAEDRLGRFAMTHQGVMERDRYLLTGCQRRNIPVVMTLGGGYAEPIDASILATLGAYRVAATLF